MKQDQVLRIARDHLAESAKSQEDSGADALGFWIIALVDNAPAYFDPLLNVGLGFKPSGFLDHQVFRRLVGDLQWERWQKLKSGARFRVEYFLADKPLFFKAELQKFTSDGVEFMLLAHHERLEFPWPDSPQLAYNYCLKTNLEGSYEYFNSNYAQVFLGEEAEERIGKDSMRDIRATSQKVTLEAAQFCISNPGKVRDVVLEKQLPNGEVLSTTWQFLYWPDEQAEDTGIYARGYDVSALEKAQYSLDQKLQELQLYYAFFENTYDALQVSKLDGSLIYINAEASRRLGIPMAEVQNYKVQDFEKIFREEPEAWAEHVQYLKDHDYWKAKTTNFNVETGEEAIVEVVVKLVQLKDDNYIVANSRDITEEERIRKAIKEKDKELSLFFNNSLMGAFFMMLPEPLEWHSGIDKDKAIDWAFENQMITRVNKAMLDQYGFSHENEFLGLCPKDFFTHDLEKGKKLWREFFDRGRWQVKSEERRNDGSMVTFEGDYVLLKDDEGRILGHFGVQQDITESERRQKALVESRERLKNLTARIPGVVFQLEQHGDNLEFSFLSPSYTGLQLGLSREQLLKSPKLLAQRIDRADYSMVVGSILYSSKREEPLSIEFRIKGEKGDLRWMRVEASGMKGEGNHTTWYGVISDLSDYKNVEEKQRQLVHASENVSDGIIILDKDVRLLWQNEAAKDFVISDLDPTYHIFEELLQVEDESLESWEALLEEMRGHHTADAQLRLRNKDEAKLWVELLHKPIWNDNGEYLYGLLLIRDINEMRTKQNDMQKLLDLTADQNKRLQSFTYIVSHNIRSYSANFAGLLDAIEYGEKEDEKKLWSYLRDVSRGLDETIRNLNKVISVNSNLNQQKQHLSVGEELERILSMLQHELDSIGAELILDIQKEDQVFAVPSYLESILLNLITNAIRYRDHHRSLQLKVSYSEEKVYSVLKVKDNGLGINLKKHGKHLFDLYQTFHKNPEARGLGLYILKSQVEAMGGKVEVKSKVDVGTSFSIYLPKV